jgi:large conductance mechanosensitive channel
LPPAVTFRATKTYRMGFVKEFKTFALKGNIIELAVAVIIGGAFGAIVSSLVEDIITPLLLTPTLEAVGAQNIAELKWGAVAYGSFLSAVIKFIVIALVLFLAIRAVNRLKTKKEETSAAPAAPELTLQEKLLIEIRDALHRQDSK